MRDTTSLVNGLKHINIELNEHQLNQMLRYYDLLIEKNKVMNLTAITEYEEVIHKHFVDSLSLHRMCSLEGKIRVLDLGTGAGFPGIPLKIAFPNLDIVLLDSLNKRITFLNEVIDDLGLEQISAIHGRAEDLGRDADYREAFDMCVSRAVANLATLSEYCLPFVKIGGSFVSYKAGNIEEEVELSQKAIKTLGGKLEKIDTFVLPQTDIERSLVQIKKMMKTLPIYPRMAGKPTKDPIK